MEDGWTTGLRSSQLARARRTLRWRREAGKLLEAAIRFGHRWHQTNAEETETTNLKTNLLENLEHSGCVLLCATIMGAWGIARMYLKIAWSWYTFGV